jgi:hypothetical protein
MTAPTRPAWRRAAGAVLPWLPVAVLVATWRAWSARLPDVLATHWSGLGVPDGFGSAAALGTLTLSLATAGALVATVAAYRARPGTPAVWLVPAGSMLAGGATGVWLTSATATLAGGSAAEARLGWRFLWLLAGLLWGMAVLAVAGRDPVRQPTNSSPAPPAPSGMTLAPGERAGFTTTLHSPLIIGVTAAAGVLMAVLAVTATPALWPVLAVPVLAGLVFAEVRVTVDRRGVRLVAGLVGLPLKRIPLADIVSVTAAEIDPMAWGGWGYRVTPGKSALILRAGPGLVLDLADGRRFAVTLDDPQTPAALLGALQAQAAGRD